MFIQHLCLMFHSPHSIQFLSILLSVQITTRAEFEIWCSFRFFGSQPPPPRFLDAGAVFVFLGCNPPPRFFDAGAVFVFLGCTPPLIILMQVQSSFFGLQPPSFF